MSDRPPPDKWLPYGERKAEGREGRKNSLPILLLPVASPVSLKEVMKFRPVVHFASCFNIYCWTSPSLSPQLMEISVPSACEEMCCFSLCEPTWLHWFSRALEVSIPQIPDQSWSNRIYILCGFYNQTETRVLLNVLLQLEWLFLSNQTHLPLTRCWLWL